MKKASNAVLSMVMCFCIIGAAPGTARAKSPALSFGLSLLIPSLGQFYNGHAGKGLLILGTEVVGAGLFAVGAAKTMVEGSVGKEEESNPQAMMAGVGLMAGAWIYSVIDAPLSSAKINRERKANTVSLNLIRGNDYTGLELTKRF